MKRTKLFLLILFLFVSTTAFALASSNQHVKKYLDAIKYLQTIHNANPTTLYCGCKYSGNSIDLISCGYKIYKNPKRASRLEWDHVVPAQAFGQSFREWRDGDPKCVTKKKKISFKGRKCAQTNDVYNRMESDMYNLYPEIGELNGLKSNYSMAAIGNINLTKKHKTFGECKAIIQDRKFEPMDMAKGVVARIYMYMDQAYPEHGIISHKNRKLFEAWDKMFPVKPWECERAAKIKEIQKNVNPILARYCKQ